LAFKTDVTRDCCSGKDHNKRKVEAQHRDFCAGEHSVAKNIGDQSQDEVKQEAFESKSIVDADFCGLNSVNRFDEGSGANSHQKDD
jgi:hypothetical protein